MKSENNSGSGLMPVQLEWISVNDRLPDHKAGYYTIYEAVKDLPDAAKGTIWVYPSDSWDGEDWWDEDDDWKVIYWAERFRLPIPQELIDRPRTGTS